MRGNRRYAWWWWITVHDPTFRITSTWINANYYAAFLLISLPLLATLASLTRPDPDTLVESQDLDMGLY